MLPLKEIKFFEWLKLNDYPIWQDLWENEDEEPYIVGLSFLPDLIDKNRGFPICDLLNNDNYYFTNLHIVNEESKANLDAIRTRFKNNLPLAHSQLLALEISIAPIDLWRFCYNHNISIEKGKEALNALLEDKILIRYKNAEELSDFI